MAIPVRHKVLNGLLATTLCVMAACVVQQAGVLMAADWSSSVARHNLSRWAAGKEDFDDTRWQQAHDELIEAIALTPKDATLQDAMAQLYSLQGQAVWTTGAEGSPEIEAYRNAMKYQQASIELRPTHAMAWANLALMHFAVNDTPEALCKAWREAARLGPREEDVENTLVMLAGETWSIAPEDVRAWVEARRPGFSERMQDTAAR